MKMTRQQRTALLKRVPWITYLDKAKSCDGVRWNKVPLKAIYPMNGKPAEGIEKWRCKAPARWKFTALRKKDSGGMRSTSGTFCRVHLHQQATYYSELERERMNRWFEEVGADLLHEDMIERNRDEG